MQARSRGIVALLVPGVRRIHHLIYVGIIGTGRRQGVTLSSGVACAVVQINARRQNLKYVDPLHSSSMCVMYMFIVRICLYGPRKAIFPLSAFLMTKKKKK